MSLVTRCPVCATAFRVQREQLGARSGKVRCGKCGQIFDGVASLVEEGAEPLRFEPSPQLGLFDASKPASTVDEGAPLPAFMAEEEPPRRWTTALWVLLSVVAAAVLAAQILHRYRSEIAAQFPGARAPLAAACRVAGCEVLLPRRATEINIESSDLQADGRREGLLVFNALLKNRATMPQEYPALELTLDDDAGRPLLRRVLMPRDYLEANRPLQQGIASGDEVAVRILLDPGTTRATGYKIRHFYP
jgi:predicted Zn finger-like uncharacterized protein